MLEHGSTAPRYTENPAYKTTSNKYEEFPGELTDRGIIQMEAIGKQLRREYIEQNQFLSNDFKPQNFYIKSYKDEPSVLSSYATMLGAYPDSISWIQFQHQGGFNEPPFTRDDELDIRKTLGLGNDPSKLSTREVTVWSETDGRTLFNDPLNNCPQMHKQMAQNLDIANSKYTANRRFDALYEEMEKTLNVPPNTLNFKNAHLYLDDYVTSQANGLPVPQFQEQVVADAWIQNYYRLYEYEGLYGTNSDLSRVAGNHFFSYVLTSMYGKYRTSKGELTNDHYDNLKYSQFTGNENAMIGAIKLLNDKETEPVYPPKFGSTMRFELYEQGGQYYVKATNDGLPANLQGDRDGVMPYEDFMKMIYKQLYFGDVDKFCAGQESANGKDKPKYEKYEDYIWSVNPDLKTSVVRVEEKKNQFVEQSFVEVKQAPEPKVIEVVEPVVVSAPVVQQRIMYNYENDIPVSTRTRSAYAQQPVYSQQQAYSQQQVYSQQPAYSQQRRVVGKSSNLKINYRRSS